MGKGRHVLIGIDLGTSYCKASIATPDGALLASTRMSSPKAHKNSSKVEYYEPAEWWNLVVDLLDEVLKSRGGVADACITVSAISPVLVKFSPEGSIGLPYWVQPVIGGDSQLSGLWRARIMALDSLSHSIGREHYITDLVGYINFQLTGIVSLNSVSAREVGLGVSKEDFEEFLERGNLEPECVGAPAEVLGTVKEGAIRERLSSTSIVTFGAPDSFCSSIGAGLSSSGECLIYLGTFGSLLVAKADLSEASISAQVDAAPLYSWILSVPGYGNWLERFAISTYPMLDSAGALKHVGEVAFSSSPGAGGSAYLLPRWNLHGVAKGGFRFVSMADSSSASVEEKCRAASESLAFSLMYGESADLLDSKSLRVTGGGAKSPAWVQTLANTLQRGLSVRQVEFDGMGALALSARASGVVYEAWDIFTQKKIYPCESTEGLLATRSFVLDQYSSTFGEQRN